VAVAEELHFTRAALRLQTAQPALSQQIRRLERELGAELFTRSNRSVELTDTGRVFLEHARRVLDEADRAKRAARLAVRGDLGRLAVGYAPETTDALLPDLLVAYRTAHPAVDLDLHQLRNADQMEALSDGRIQVGLMTFSVEDTDLDSIFLRRQRLVVALPASHRLAGKQSLRIRELAGERWVHPAANSGPLFNACAAAGFEPLIAQPTVEHAARMALVAAGVGVAIEIETNPRLASRHIVYRPLVRPEISVDVVAAWRPDRMSPLLDGFIESARSVRRSRRSTARTSG
jgi:DNA-binding transcriptional LysR family regulator